MKNKGGSAEDVFDMVKIRIMKSGVKKNGYFTVRLTVSVCMLYDCMWSEIDFTPEKSNYKSSQLLLTAAAALSQKRSDSGIAEA